MPDSFFGIGTREYGRTETSPDGSYVTTKFFTLLYIPLWPLESRKVRYRIEKHVDRMDIKRYILKRLPIRWGQVAKVMATTLGICLVALVALGIIVEVAVYGNHAH